MKCDSYRNSLVLAFVLFANTARGSADSNGINGINSSGLGLTGNGIGIGQIELERPGDPSFDSMGSLFHASVDPAGVFFRNPGVSPTFIATFDATIDTAAEVHPHAVQVAGVMISSDGTATGVATNANLFSAGINPMGTDIEVAYAQAAITAQHVATRNGGDVRAINASFGAIPLPNTDLDGRSLLTSFSSSKFEQEH